MVLAIEWVCKELMHSIIRNNNSNYSKVACLGCIILLLHSGFPYNVNLSFDKTAYGQQQTIDLKHNGTDIVTGPEQVVGGGKIAEYGSNDKDEASKTFPRPTDGSVIDGNEQLPTKEEDDNNEQPQQQQPPQ